MGLVVVAPEPGGPEALRFEQRTAPRPGPTDLLVRVHATAVNRADVLQRRGLYPPPPGASEVLGLELAGEVAAVGAQVEGWAVGDACCAVVAGGGYAQEALVPAATAMPLPPGLDFEQAAAVPEAFATAWDNVHLRGRLVQGETLLVHGGAGGVGSAAIQLGKRAGARVLATAGGPDRARACEALGAEVGIDYRERDFVEAVRESTGGRGADVILDVMGAVYLARNLDALAIEGRCVVIGLQGGLSAEINLGLVLTKRLTLLGSTLRARTTEQKAALARALVRDVWPGFADGALRPVVHTVLPLDQVAEAHRLLERGEQVGKVVLRVP